MCCYGGQASRGRVVAGVVREVGDRAEWFKALMQINRGARELDQENKAEASEQGNEPQKLNELHKQLLFGFALIAGVAIGAYAFRFWGWPSVLTSPSDWAYFATYLSGTVGVTAVVATLIVLVRTLGQQEYLIESQSEMLNEQRRQIVLAEKQNDELSKNNKIDLAFKNTSTFFDFYLTEYSNSLKYEILPYTADKVFYEKFYMCFDKDIRMLKVIYHNPLKLEEVFEGLEFEPVSNYMDRFFKTVDALYRFICAQIELAPFLKDYFDIKLSVDSSYSDKFYMHCYQAYLIGSDNLLYKKGVTYLDLQNDYRGCGSDNLEKWQELGETFKKMKLDNEAKPAE